MWTVRRRAWGLQNHIIGDVPALVSRLMSRLFDGSTAQYILGQLTMEATAIWVVIGLLAATLTLLAYQHAPMHRGALVAAATSVLYFCGIYAAYLGTPASLEFHLSTSAGRTMATASVGLLVCLYFLLTGLEADETPGARVARQ